MGVLIACVLLALALAGPFIYVAIDRWRHGPTKTGVDDFPTIGTYTSQGG